MESFLSNDDGDGRDIFAALKRSPAEHNSESLKGKIFLPLLTIAFAKSLYNVSFSVQVLPLMRLIVSVLATAKLFAVISLLMGNC